MLEAWVTHTVGPTDTQPCPELVRGTAKVSSGRSNLTMSGNTVDTLNRIKISMPKFNQKNFELYMADIILWKILCGLKKTK